MMKSHVTHTVPVDCEVTMDHGFFHNPYSPSADYEAKFSITRHQPGDICTYSSFLFVTMNFAANYGFETCRLDFTAAH